MSTHREKITDYRQAQSAYLEMFGWWPICGFPQFKSNEEFYAAVNEALETGVEIKEEPYDQSSNIIY